MGRTLRRTEINDSIGSVLERGGGGGGATQGNKYNTKLETARLSTPYDRAAPLCSVLRF